MTSIVLLDPAAQVARVVPSEMAQDFDADWVSIAIADDFTWAGKCVDWAALAIIDDMPALRAAKTAAVNDRRLEAESAGCNTPFGVVESDERSRGLISGAALMAFIAKASGQPFDVSWTMHDNSQQALDADGMIGVGVAVGAYISAVHARGVELKAAIDDASDLEALNAIDINAGWPE